MRGEARGVSETYIHDSPAAIEVCLHCPRAECTGNCLEMQAARRGRKVTRRYNRIVYAADGTGHTVAEWAKISGVNRTTIDQRLRRGLPLEVALRGGNLSAMRVTARGTEMTVKEWATALGVHPSLIHGRLKRGESMDAIADYYEARAARRADEGKKHEDAS